MLRAVASDRAFLKLYRDRVAVVPLFSGLSDKELRSLAKRADQLSVVEGSVLVAEGGYGSEFFVLLSGAAKVTKNGRTIRKLGPGDSFGELGLIADLPRTASVVITEPSELMVLARPDFNKLLDEFPRVSRKMLASLAALFAEKGV